VPVAYVVPAGDLDAAGVAAGLPGRVAPYKRVDRVVTVDRLPRSPAGKLLRCG
jgi:acyl-CoA synthetase (AMP-forming)/AMP-acid ligase II